MGTVCEGVALREAGLGQTIVPLMGAISREDWQAAAAHDLTPLLTDFEDIEKAAACCRRTGRSGWPSNVRPA